MESSSLSQAGKRVLIESNLVGTALFNMNGIKILNNISIEIYRTTRIFLGKVT